MTNIITLYLTGKDLNYIYNGLPEYCKNKDDKGNTYKITVKQNNTNITNDLSVGLFMTNNGDVSTTKKLRDKIEEFIIKKYSEQINNELEKLDFWKQVKTITLENK